MMHGSLPATFKNLRNLILLHVEEVDLPFPTEEILQNLVKLEKLIFWTVSMIPMSIPESVGNLSSLTELNLNGGAYARIPTSIGRLKNLQTLRLDSLFYDSSATIPTEIGSLTNLKTLKLNADHDVSLGTIPTEIGKLLNLTTISLRESACTGQLPSELGLLNKLSLFNVRGSHRISGTIPKEMANLPNFEALARLQEYAFDNEGVSVGFYTEFTCIVSLF